LEFLKIKKFQIVDLRIKKIGEGEGKCKGKAGALTVDYKGNELRVGTGFTDEQREMFWQEKPIGRMIEVSYFAESKNKKDILSVIEKYKKRAQDDWEILKIRQKEVKELKSYLTKGTVGKLESLTSSAEALQKADVKKLKADNLVKFFEDAKSMLENSGYDNPMIKHLETLIESMNVLKKDKASVGVEDKIKTVIDQIFNLTEKTKEG
jgi:hypothetical protein